MQIRLFDRTTDQSFHVSSVRFEPGFKQLKGFVWTITPGPPPGEYLLKPFGFRVTLLGVKSGDNHLEFVTVDVQE